MNKKIEQYYEIKLEDYSTQDACATKSYYGTLDDIGGLILALTEHEWTAENYASTIHAFEEFMDGNHAATHVIADTKLRLLTPVKVLCASEILHCNAKWSYYIDGDTKMHMQAQLLDATQVILQDGDQYIRCIRPCFEEVQYRDRLLGWCSVRTSYSGFPNIFCDFPEENALNMRLFVPEQVSNTLEDCVFEMGSLYHMNLTRACEDLLGMYQQ